MQNIFPTRREIQDVATSQGLGDTQATMVTSLLGNMMTAASTGLKTATVATSGKSGMDVHTIMALARVLGYDVSLDSSGVLRLSWG